MPANPKPRIWGFIISNRGWDGQTQLEMGMSSFGRTAGIAWRRHIGHERAASPDFPIIVQRWSDRGYLPIYVGVELASHIRTETAQHRPNPAETNVNETAT